MSLVLHLLKADLRRHWRWLLAWGLCLLLEFVFSLPGWDRLFADAGTISVLDALRLSGNQVGLMIAGIIVIGAIQADSGVASTRFWLTRPIPRPSIVASKLALILLLALGGALVEAIIASLVRPGAGLVAVLFVEAAWIRLVGFMVVAALAAITPDASRFLMAFVGLLVALPATGFLIASLVRLVDRGDTRAAEIEVTLVALAVVVVGCAAIIAHQVLRRRLRASLLMAAATVLVVYGVLLFWPWALWRHAATPETEQVAALDSVAVDSSLRLAPFARQGGRTQVAALLTLRASGIPASTAPRLADVRGAWKVPLELQVGTASERVPFHQHYSLSLDLHPFAARLTGYRWLNPGDVPNKAGGNDAEGWSLTVGYRFTAARFEETAGLLEAKARLGMQRLVPLARLPLQTGTEVSSGGIRFSVVDVRRREGGVGLLLREVRPDPLFGAHRIQSPVVLLINAQRGEVMTPSPELRFGPMINANGVTALTFQRRYREFGADPSAASAIDADWLAGAEVQVFGVEETIIERHVSAVGRVESKSGR